MFIMNASATLAKEGADIIVENAFKIGEQWYSIRLHDDGSSYAGAEWDDRLVRDVEAVWGELLENLKLTTPPDKIEVVADSSGDQVTVTDPSGLVDRSDVLKTVTHIRPDAYGSTLGGRFHRLHEYVLHPREVAFTTSTAYATPRPITPPLSPSISSTTSGSSSSPPLSHVSTPPSSPPISPKAGTLSSTPATEEAKRMLLDKLKESLEAYYALLCTKKLAKEAARLGNVDTEAGKLQIAANKEIAEKLKEIKDICEIIDPENDLSSELKSIFNKCSNLEAELSSS